MKILQTKSFVELHLHIPIQFLAFFQLFPAKRKSSKRSNYPIGCGTNASMRKFNIILFQSAYLPHPRTSFLILPVLCEKFDKLTSHRPAFSANKLSHLRHFRLMSTINTSLPRISDNHCAYYVHTFHTNIVSYERKSLSQCFVLKEPRAG